MKQWRHLLATGCAALLFSSCNLQDVVERSTSVVLTDSEIINGLKESLVLGSKTAASNLGVQDGYLKNELVKIILPDTVAMYVAELEVLESKVTNLLKQNAQNQFLGKQASHELQTMALELSATVSFIKPYKDSIVTALNRGAEQAAPNSIDVFKNAIFDMSFNDAKGLLHSKDTIAVTGFLHQLTYSGLNVAFRPILKEPLDYINPNKYWTPVASGYNNVVSKYNLFRNGMLSNPLTSSSAPAAPKYSSAPTDLSDYLATYATGKALDGLFYMVGVQESKLRADPWGALAAVGNAVTSTVRDLIGKVFEEAG